MSDEASKATGTSRQQLLLRGESLVAVVGIAGAAILLCAMGAVAWWTVSTHRDSMRQARVEQIRGMVGIVAQTAESMLVSGDVSSLRRLVVEAKRENELLVCRVKLPDGRIIADAEPSQITLSEVPERWSGPIESAGLVRHGDRVELTQPLLVRGRGMAVLRVEANADPSWFRVWEMQAGVGLIGAAALGGLLLAYRHIRGQIRTVGLIRESLLALRDGETARDALVVGGLSEPEVEAWNNLVTEAWTLRKQAAKEQIKELLDSGASSNGDLTGACDALPLGMVVADEHGRVKYANGAAGIFLQKARDALVGSHLEDVVADEQVAAAVKSALASEGTRRTVEVERGGGGVLRFNIRPLRSTDARGLILTVEDVTQQRVADASRSSFIAQATHEIRAPLTNMRLYLDAALEEGQSDPAMLGKCLNVLGQEARRLERMVGEMLSVAEIEAGSLKMRQDDVRVDKLMEELQVDYEEPAKEKKIALKFDLPPKFSVILGDRDKLALALHNLVGNALKYTPENGKVTVVVKEEKGKLTVEVSDTGIGIDEKEQESIFERFYRAKDPRVAQITGTGLGLALAREVARGHGGDITVQSQLNHGSVFTLVVPIRTRSAAAAA